MPQILRSCWNAPWLAGGVNHRRLSLYTATEVVDVELPTHAPGDPLLIRKVLGLPASSYKFMAETPKAAKP